MERIKSLNRYQKALLIILLLMPLIFWGVYHMTINRRGFEFKGKILVPEQVGDKMVYSGKIKGKKAVFTVDIITNDRIEFTYGNKTYGPYTVEEDPNIDTDNNALSRYVTLYNNGKLVLSGEIQRVSNAWIMFKNGNMEVIDFGRISVGFPSTTDKDPMEPSVTAILDLFYNVNLTHNGDWRIWIVSTALCIPIAISILFADEIFRRQLGYRIKNPKKAEPSDWEIASRYIGWTMATAAVLIYFIIGLQ